jgi:membrane-associated phospholipid phosphatase
MLLTVILISGRSRNNFVLTIADVGILVVGLLPGLLHIYLKTRRGDFGHYHLLLKEERRVVLPLLFAGMVASFVLYILTQAPSIMLRGMVVGLLAGVGAMAISRFWKISLHAAVAMGCAALFIPISWTILLVIGSLGIIVGASRLVVKHHTPAQVIGGWIYGFGITSLLVRLLLV